MTPLHLNKYFFPSQQLHQLLLRVISILNEKLFSEVTSLEHHRKKIAAEAASTPETQISPVLGVQGFKASL